MCWVFGMLSPSIRGAWLILVFLLYILCPIQIHALLKNVGLIRVLASWDSPFCYIVKICMPHECIGVFLKRG